MTKPNHDGGYTWKHGVAADEAIGPEVPDTGPEKVHRMTVEFNTPTMRVLEHVKRRLSAKTKAEVVRRALLTYRTLLEADKVVAHMPDGTRRILLLETPPE